MRYSTLAQAAIIAAVAAPALARPVEIRSFEPEDAVLIERELLTDVAARADYSDLVARAHQRREPPSRPRPPPINPRPRPRPNPPPAPPNTPTRRPREDVEMLYEREFVDELVARDHERKLPPRLPSHPPLRLASPRPRPNPPALPLSTPQRRPYRRADDDFELFARGDLSDADGELFERALELDELD
ncbi:uncharacterized protein B0H18DRAFT_1212514 [Fomitopsis serialis]|uniref:uncharacterized protein n=1 Tax=Fomitopsis serialis TaxID=139415 RepID=UPI002007894F|nr:uncharacterized protein B0H18DRAFT_1212514 [Neoantrodia serialis]KAH9922645.1 hypothetical protein B0H18DRAFT_1212514 [Neoantrodia serialis]